MAEYSPVFLLYPDVLNCILDFLDYTSMTDMLRVNKHFYKLTKSMLIKKMTKIKNTINIDLMRITYEYGKRIQANEIKQYFNPPLQYNTMVAHDYTILHDKSPFSKYIGRIDSIRGNEFYADKIENHEGYEQYKKDFIRFAMIDEYDHPSITNLRGS